jgi:hypothetical protein
MRDDMPARIDRALGDAVERATRELCDELVAHARDETDTLIHEYRRHFAGYGQGVHGRVADRKREETTMRIYKIAVYGDNDALHQAALTEAVKAIEETNKAPTYRAWIEPVEVTPTGAIVEARSGTGRATDA